MRAGVPAAQIADGRFGEPWLVGAVDRAVGHVLAGEGAYVAALLGIAALFVGVGVLFTRTDEAGVDDGNRGGACSSVWPVRIWAVC